MGWAIDGEQLRVPARRGGRDSRRGSAYQDSYAVLQLVTLAEPGSELVALRSEGSQDVDLKLADGRERYVQLKDRPRTRYSIAEMAPIIGGFTRDWLDAGRPENLEFELITSGGRMDNAMAAIVADGVGAPQAEKLVEAVVTKGVGGGCEAWEGGDNEDRADWVRHVLARTSLRLGIASTLQPGHPGFRDTAQVRLAGLGVASDEIGQAYEALHQAIRDGEASSRDDVRAILEPFLVRSNLTLFDNKMRAVDADLLVRSSSDRGRRDFLRSGRLNWEVIAAGIDVERDQTPTVAQLLREQEEQLAMVVIVDAPGTGKSTIAWRVGADLAMEGHTVLHLRSGADASPLQRLEAFCAKVPGKVIVIVDDVFRREERIEALRELEPSLPVTFLATSNANEYVEDAIAGDMHRVDLDPLSREERLRVIDRVGTDDLDNAARERLLQEAPTITALVREATGEGGERSLRKAIERLEREDPSGYEIYRCVTFCSRVGTDVPISLLTRIGGRAMRPSLRGLLQPVDSRPDRVNAGHLLTAAISWGVFAEKHDPGRELERITAQIDPSDLEERRFLLAFLRALSRTESSLSEVVRSAETAYAAFESSLSATELSGWASFWSSLDEEALADATKAAILVRPPTSGHDLLAIVSVLRQEGRDQEGLLMLEKWLGANDWFEGRSAYVRAARLHGNAQQRRDALRSTGEWLRAHPDHSTVRGALLRLAVEEGPAAVKSELDRAIERLAEQPNDRNTREAALFAARNAEDEQVRRLFADTKAWLSEWPSAAGVWGALAALVRARGSDFEVAWMQEKAIAAGTGSKLVRAITKGYPELMVRVISVEIEHLEKTYDSAPGDAEVKTALVDAARRLRRYGGLDERLRLLHKQMALHPSQERLVRRACAYSEVVLEEDEMRGLVEDVLAWAFGQPGDAGWEQIDAMRTALLRLPRDAVTRRVLLAKVDTLLQEMARDPATPSLVRDRIIEHFVKGGRRTLAIRIAEYGIKMDNLDPCPHEALAELLLLWDGTRLRRCLSEWNWLVARDPGCGRFLFGRGRARAMLAWQERDREAALSLHRESAQDFAGALDRWTPKDGSRDQVLRFASWAAVHLERPRKALATIDEIEGPTKDSPSVQLACAEAHLLLGEDEAAAQIAEKILMGDPREEGAGQRATIILQTLG